MMAQLGSNELFYRYSMRSILNDENSKSTACTWPETICGEFPVDQLSAIGGFLSRLKKKLKKTTIVSKTNLKERAPLNVL